MTRRRRSLAAFLAAFALVFAQFAVSAHACASAALTISKHAPVAHPQGCPDEDRQSDLCSQHCQYGSASVDMSKPVPAIDAAIGPVVALLAVPRDPARASRLPSAFSPTSGPPHGARQLPLRL